METYVKIYGKHDRNNLVFVRSVQGGSGRGAVDDYNLLCDIPNNLCRKAKEDGLEMPGPVRKFLAKDIMFAGGKVSGWETWLAERRERGFTHGMEALSIARTVDNLPFEVGCRWKRVRFVQNETIVRKVPIYRNVMFTVSFAQVLSNQ